MSAIVIDRRPGGIVETLHDDNAVSIAQDVSAIVDFCRRQRTENDRFRGFRRPPEFSHVASIPLALIDILRARGRDIMHDEDALRDFLNNPDNAVFRTSGGRV